MNHANIHKKCSCYQKGNRQIICLKEIPAGETCQFYLNSHCIVFVLDGTVECSVSGFSNASLTVRSDEFIFLPVSTMLTMKASEDTSTLCFRIDGLMGSIAECSTFRFQRLSENIKINEVFDGSINPLVMNERIRYLVNGVVFTERDGLKCANYAKHIVAQLLTEIQFYYTQEEYMRFYSTVASPEVAFSDLVYEKWTDCRSVGELANHFEMSIYQFNIRFFKVFGETPGRWLKRHRNEKLYRDICCSNKSLSEVASEHKFLPTNLIRYSRENFGETPGRIRERLTSDAESSITRCAGTSLGTEQSDNLS